MVQDSVQGPSNMASGRSSPETDDPRHRSRVVPNTSTPLSVTDTESSEARQYLARHANEPQNFTLRGILVGLIIGIVICFSNMYFGLQTGWVSSMAMPSALIGFAYFKAVSRYLNFPFTPVENVLVQSVAGSVGTMPLGCGFVGVIPALNYLLTSDENGPLHISLWKLIVWSVGICFFGVVFAVPLRREVIIREKLKFPSGTASALMIGVLHGEKGDGNLLERPKRSDQFNLVEDEHQHLLSRPSPEVDDESDQVSYIEMPPNNETIRDFSSDWKAKIKLLIISFCLSGLYTLISYFIPQFRNVPIFGLKLAQDWLWTLNPSPAYVGQGIIMGPATTLHMLFGAIIGWGVLSPVAKSQGWAPGPVSDWESGSKGWIVWISLAIMLADSLVSLGWLVLRPTINYGYLWLSRSRIRALQNSWTDVFSPTYWSNPDYSTLQESIVSQDSMQPTKDTEDSELDAPQEHLISTRTTTIGMIISLGLCIASVHYSFPGLIPLHLTLVALFLALLLSIMGVRALGETDLNPVSGISKVTQLIFALITPSSGPAAKNAVIINLLAGAISESGALQAGDLMQDLKTGHLLGAAPNAQFWGQIIGSAVGAVVSAVVYKLYTHVYQIPGGLFQVPTGYVWIFTARLVTGQGLPPKVSEWAAGAAIIFSISTALRIFGNARKAAGKSAKWIDWVPGGIAVAVGMYNVPSFTLARAAGGLINLFWRHYKGKSETPIVILASGLILGEGLFSIANLLLASVKVPHL